MELIAPPEASKGPSRTATPSQHGVANRLRTASQPEHSDTAAIDSESPSADSDNACIDSAIISACHRAVQQPVVVPYAVSADAHARCDGGNAGDA